MTIWPGRKESSESCSASQWYSVRTRLHLNAPSHFAHSPAPPHPTQAPGQPSVPHLPTSLRAASFLELKIESIGCVTRRCNVQLSRSKPYHLPIDNLSRDTTWLWQWDRSKRERRPMRGAGCGVRGARVTWEGSGRARRRRRCCWRPRCWACPAGPTWHTGHCDGQRKGKRDVQNAGFERPTHALYSMG